MPRPKKCRCVRGEPNVTYFKPRGIPITHLEEVVLVVEELEAMRLKDVEGLDQAEAARTMKISRTTFHRILKAARAKVTEALIQGKAIKIEGGDYVMAGRKFTCGKCGSELEFTHEAPRPTECPQCKETNIHRNKKDRGRLRRGAR